MNDYLKVSAFTLFAQLLDSGYQKGEKRKMHVGQKAYKGGYAFDTNTYSLSSNIQFPAKPMVEIMDKITQLKIREIE